MFRRFSTNFALLSMLLDALTVIFALFFANLIRPTLNDLPWAATVNQPSDLPLVLFVVFPFIWVAVLLLFSVYDGRKNLRAADEFTALTLGSILAGVALAGALYLSFRDISRALFLVFGTTAYLMQVAWRLLARQVFRLNNGNYASHRRVLIVGAGPVGRDLQEEIARNSFLGLEAVGFVDDDPNKRLIHRDVLGNLGAARRIVLNHKINDVVIALPPRAHERVNNLVAELHDLPVKVWVIPDYFHLALHKAVSEEFAGIPMLDLRAPALNDYQRMVKRAFDLLISAILFFPVTIFITLIGVLIYLDNPGPIFFHQKRAGENGRLFDMIKFRTMVENAEQLRHLVETIDNNGDLQHKHPDDPRVTRLGKFLRRTSLDELPQLFNVIKGDMSLVGPRPELPYLVEKYQPWQRKRFAVPQGITGWWQVNGRSEKPMHLNTEDDLYYVQHYSIWLDLQILLKTVWVVLRGKGAF
jgi:exopolysaccharide biosynthesis polyprenyl glycosylphosphotransferase